MKFLLRNTVIYTFTLFLLPQFLGGIKVSGGLPMLIFSGFILTLMYLILRPIINIISFPLNVLTLGLFSLFTNVIILYLLTVFVPGVIVSPFTFMGFMYGGFIIPKAHFGIFGAYAIVGIALAFLSNFFRWIVK